MNRFRDFVREAGRDPNDVPIEARIHYRDGDQERWKRELETWRKRDAEYVSFVTMDAGLRTPDEHIEAIDRFLKVARTVI